MSFVTFLFKTARITYNDVLLSYNSSVSVVVKYCAMLQLLLDTGLSNYNALVINAFAAGCSVTLPC